MGLTSGIKALPGRLLLPLAERMNRLENEVAALRGQVETMGRSLEQELERTREALGRIEKRQLANSDSTVLADFEFTAFSQWGEDGIIQHLIERVAIDQETFVEFGVGDYRESNTRFLLANNNWKGLVMDSGTDNINHVRESEICWRHGLQAVQAFISRDNINELIAANGIKGDIGLLSIDIDGNDYWVWKAIDAVNPVIVVIEYNHRFGSELAVTIPYDENFRRGEQYPVTYFGASLAALCALGNQKGYAFVGCNRNGVNAFFVRRDRLPESLRELTVATGYVDGHFTETRDESGRFIPVPGKEERQELLSLPLIDVSGPNG